MKQIKLKALSHHIPILSDEGILFIKEQIKQRHLKSMLEIGTAIGYSSIAFSDDLQHITTLEREAHLYEMALKNIEDYQKTNIEVVLIDALNYTPTQTFDLIFIDAAKAQYERFFNRFSPYLNPGGVIICDNLNFHHLDKYEVSKQTRNLIRKIENFKTFLKNNPHFNTIINDVGDGMSISWRKHENTNNPL